MSLVLFSYFSRLVVIDITYNTKDIQKNVNFYKYKVSSILENEVHYKGY